MILTEPRVDAGELEKRTGWTLRPEGLCKAEVCIPVSPRLDENALDAETLARALRAPLVRDEAHDLWCVGPPAGRALLSAQAPDLVLPDLDGEPFALRSLRTQKVFLLAWASW
jgi:hypothetical protein